MIKQVIIMRKDLNMRKGKIAAQAGHACVNCVLKAAARVGGLLDWDSRADQGSMMSVSGRGTTAYLNEWFSNEYTKICVTVNSEKELLEYYKKIEDAGYVVHLVQDMGHTGFKNKKTYTCLAVEPLPAEVIDEITGSLPLY